MLSSRKTKRRRTEVKAHLTRPWGLITAFVAVALVAAGIVGFAAYTTWRTSRPAADRLAAITGLVDYRRSDPASLSRQHKAGQLAYKTTPPVGGDHNAAWQNCSGVIYDAPIADEHATHSLEHGAVWITYRTGLPTTDVDQLTAKVRGVDYMLLSPVDKLGSPISLQAWGYRMAVDSATDKRITEFIRAARITAAAEPGATCGGGITTTGTTPQDEPATMPQGQ